jgi:hypothetical protein
VTWSRDGAVEGNSRSVQAVASSTSHVAVNDHVQENPYGMSAADEPSIHDPVSDRQEENLALLPMFLRRSARIGLV